MRLMHAFPHARHQVYHPRTGACLAGLSLEEDYPRGKRLVLSPASVPHESIA